jgi:hypothetical protein
MNNIIQRQKEWCALLDLRAGDTSARVIRVSDNTLLFTQNMSDNDLTSACKMNGIEESNNGTRRRELLMWDIECNDLRLALFGRQPLLRVETQKNTRDDSLIEYKA